MNSPAGRALRIKPGPFPAHRSSVPLPAPVAAKGADQGDDEQTDKEPFRYKKAQTAEQEHEQ